MLSAVWGYRHFIVSSIRSDIRARFAHSKISGIWLLIQPLVQVAMYTTVLSTVLAARLPGVTDRYGYAIYLLSGLLAWSIFNEVVSRSLTVFVDSASLLKKIVFPRICLPLIVLGGALINFAVLLAATIGLLMILNRLPSAIVFYLIPLALLAAAIATGLGVVLGVLNVFVRDVGQTAQITLQLLFWFTPIVYPVSILPASVQRLLSVNPLYPLVTGFQDVLFLNRAPDTASLLYPAVVALVLTGLALYIFRMASPDMADVL